jgi:hypothetical protein
MKKEIKKEKGHFGKIAIINMESNHLSGILYIRIMIIKN